MNSLEATATAAAPRDAHDLVLRRPVQIREWVACAMIAMVWFGALNGLRPLAIPDEGRYVGVAWEMLRSGDWLVPTLDGMPFLHKPPLFYWITAAAMHVMGAGVAAARTASWLAAVATATGLFAFIRRWADTRQAWTTVIVLATMPIFFGGAQYANLDMLVAACITGSILLTVHAALAREQQLPYRRALALAFVVTACGVLSKGLIGAVLPAGVLLAWGASTRRFGKVLALLVWAPGWLLFMAIAAPWFVAMQQRFPDFGHYFFVVQHVQRFASDGFNSPQPWWFFPAVLVTLSLPWSAWLLARLRRSEPGRSQPSPVHTLMLVWLAAVTLFFSVPSSKLIGYILPVIPALAYLIAEACRPSQRAGGHLAPRATTVVAAGLCVGIVVAAHFHQPKSMQAIGARLKAMRGPGEAVISVGRYYYDLPFYAALDAPVIVMDRWAAAEVAKDSWRRELTDAARFAPAASPGRLLPVDELASRLCLSGSSWVVGPWPPEPEAGLPMREKPVYESDGTALWRIVPSVPSTRRALSCREAAGPAPAQR